MPSCPLLPRDGPSIIAGVFALAAAACGGTRVLHTGGEPIRATALRLAVSASGTIAPEQCVAVSPDGKRVAFVAADASVARIWVRALDQVAAFPIPGTDGASHPFWSPGGHALAFTARNQLRRVDLASGLVRTIADGVSGMGGTWSADGIILFVRGNHELAAVPDDGGTITSILTADPKQQETRLLWPRFLPDGNHFIYFAASEQAERRGVYVGALDSHEPKFLLRSDLAAWSTSHYLVIARDATLLAQPFDVTRLELLGSPTVIVEGVWSSRATGQACFSVSETGVLAYMNAARDSVPAGAAPITVMLNWPAMLKK